MTYSDITGYCCGTLPPYPLIPSDDFSKDMWIAGGAARRRFRMEKLSDIDLFFRNEEALSEFKKKTKLTFVSESKNCLSYKTNDGIPVQAIKVRYYNDLDELFDSFDYTLCQFAITNEGKVYATTYSILSVLTKRLAIHKIQQGFELASFKRAFKYAKKGFMPCNGTILNLHQILTKLSSDHIKNQIEMSPNGSMNFIRID